MDTTEISEQSSYFCNNVDKLFNGERLLLTYRYYL